MAFATEKQVIRMILGHEESKILQLATDYQSEMTDGVVQYNYETGEIFGAGFTTGTIENPANPFIEVFRLPQGEMGEIDCGCDDCPFRNEDARYPDWEKLYPESREECCMEAYIDVDFRDDWESNWREIVEEQIRDVFKDYLGDTLSKLNEIRIAISDIVAPYDYYNIRQDNWEMRVLDNLVDDALESGFSFDDCSEFDFLDAEVQHFIGTCEESENEYLRKAGCLIEAMRLDEALKCLS